VHEFVSRMLGEAQKGSTDTRPEIGTLLSTSPLSFKLEKDPAPLEPDELMKLKTVEISEMDVGKEFALLRCTNGKYLILGEVE
jgi:hypothetical protein